MVMKKFINDPLDVTDESVEGFVRAHRDKLRKIDGMCVAVRRDAPKEGKVGVVIGGGSGHEPMFIGFVGRGMADAAVAGAIFTSPTPDQILEATRTVNGGAGVIYVYGNYAGDNLNFDMAAEMAKGDGIDVETVRVWDDIASAPPERVNERRGIAGDLFVIKTAGAKAETMATLSEVKRVTERARDNTRSFAVALSSCTLPTTGRTIFTIGDDEMELGMGAHGEPGVERTKMRSADEIAEIVTSKVLEDLPFEGGDEVNVIINGLGSTTLMELYILYRRTDAILEERGLKIYDVEIGNFITTQEMAGYSLTLMRLDEEIKELWNALADAPAFKKL